MLLSLGAAKWLTLLEGEGGVEKKDFVFRSEWQSNSLLSSYLE